MKKQTKIILAIALIIALVASMIGAYLHFRPGTTEGAKSITLQVVDDQGKTTQYEVKTDGSFLSDVMEDAKEQGLTYEGEEGDYGLTIHTVNGVKADYNTDGAYWSFTVNDEYCNYGPDQQPANDGDVFSIEYTVME